MKVKHIVCTHNSCEKVGNELGGEGEVINNMKKRKLLRRKNDRKMEPGANCAPLPAFCLAAISIIGRTLESREKHDWAHSN